MIVLPRGASPAVAKVAAESRPDRAELARFLARHETNPYQPYADLIPASALDSWRRDRAEKWLAARGGFHFVRESGELNGAASWTHLQWDSGHLGVQVGRIDLLASHGSYHDARRRNRQLLSAVIEESREQRIGYLTARTDAGDVSAIHSLEAEGFALIDGIQTFGLRLGSECAHSIGSDNGIEVGAYAPWQMDGILEIAFSAYQFDRFHSDPVLDRSRSDRLHSDWVRNSCEGKASDAVFVAHRDHQVLGFATLKLDAAMFFLTGIRLATIVLVATASAARGQGVGRLTTLHLVHSLAQQGVSAIQVGTQLRNTPAARLYESCGFRLIGAGLTFRKTFGRK